MSQPASNKLGVNTRSNADRIIQELPNSRQFSRISPDLVARIGDRSYPVIDLSLGGVALRMPARDLPSDPPYHCEILEPGAATKRMAAFWIDPVCVGERRGDRIGFRIAEIDGEAQFDLRLLIMSHLESAAPHDSTSVNGEVRVVRQTPTDTPSVQPRRVRIPVHRWVGYAVWLTLALVLLTAVGLSAFDAMYGVRSVSAAVAAPAVVVRAPQSGFVHANGLDVGDGVAREQLVVTIRDPKLEAELAVAQAQLGAGADRFFSERDLELARIRLAALELRHAQSKVYSPCDCIVLDIGSAYGGEWLHAGDRLMTLVPRDPDEILIYALVPADKAHRLAAGQKVAVTFPLTRETVDGAIEDILMRDRTARWAGLPDWFAKSGGKIGVLVRPSQALSPQAVGQPAEISTTNMTLRQLAAAVARYVAVAGERIGADDSG